MSEVVLSARGLEKTFKSGSLEVPVLRGIDLDIRAGETLARGGRFRIGQEHLAPPPGGGWTRPAPER